MTITVRVRVRVRVRVEEKTRTPCDSQTKASSSLKMSLTCGKWLVSFSSSDSERDSELYEHSSELVVTPVQSSGVPGSDNCPSIHPSIHPSSDMDHESVEWLFLCCLAKTNQPLISAQIQEQFSTMICTR